MKMERIRELLGMPHETPPPPEDNTALNIHLLHPEQKEEMESAMSILDDNEGALEKKVHQEAEKTVQTAAEDTLKKMHVIQMGRCPVCSEHLSRHLFTSVCEACGWNDYEVPSRGPVRVYLRNRPEPIEGDRCYFVKPDALLVVRNEVVIARVNRDITSHVEYIWTPEEIDQRQRRILEQMTLFCGWCNQICDPDKDGFHSVQIAFGSTQERYTFCTDECYEAFRKMYPARVHRDCYERNCADCNLCLKRYDDDVEGVRVLAKDYIKPPKKV